MSALESMSVGTPVIAPSVGGLPEIIDAGVTGLLAPFTNSMDEAAKLSGLAEQVKQALALSKKDQAAMGTAAKRKVRAQFVGTEQQYVSIFETVNKQRG